MYTIYCFQNILQEKFKDTKLSKSISMLFLKTKMNCETSINYKKKKGGINQMYNDKQVLMIIY